MKRIITLLVAGLAACTSGQEEDMLTKIDKEVRANAQVYQTLAKSMSTIGHRLTGSPNGKMAEEETYELFKSYGYDNVRYYPFEVETWTRGEVSLQVSDAAGEMADMSVISLAHSPVEANVEAEIVDVGNGLEADFEAAKDQVKGKIAMCYISILPESGDAKNLHRSEKTKLATDYGAIGLIIFNQVPGGVLLTGTASVTGKLIPIPAVCISYEDGFALKERLKSESVTAKIEMTNVSDNIKARNVIATIEGTDYPEERIIVGGHLDSWDLATGAIDNGIGSFSVIDIARTFKALDIKPKRTIEFIMWMGEEQGLLGSRDYVRTNKEAGTLDNIKYVMNLDAGTNPRGLSGGGRAEAEEFFRAVGQKIQAVDTAFANDFVNRAGLHSDQQPFMLEGIPYFSAMGGGDRSIYDCYHADCDDIDLVNKEHLENNVRISSMALYEVAMADQLPAAKLDDEATKTFLERHGLKLKLKIAGDWRWGD
ncbi:MAG: M28 family peptidase [Bacteroidota bacterium]